ncbi:MAG: NAD(+)/NADH kinase [Deltaproteobacteria bacterium]|nr:NAD(+)/NADH kinase [Nannocystaceae bacterium]
MTAPAHGDVGPVRHVALFPRDGLSARLAVHAASRMLTAAGVKVSLPREWSMTPGSEPSEPHDLLGDDEVHDGIDLVITLGGDGTLLRAAKWVGAHGIAVMGVNLGHLGFLTAYGAAELDEALRAAIAGELTWQSRLRMHVEVRRQGQLCATQSGCNDTYVKHGELPRMLQLRTTIGGAFAANLRADGIIVSTPMGSTAYNLAAGGPIVEAGSDTWTLTPICPHTLTHRPVVTRADRELTIEYAGPEDAGAATLSVDGQWSYALQVGDCVSIRCADHPLRLVPPRVTVFEVLAHKLGWGG